MFWIPGSSQKVFLNYGIFPSIRSPVFPSGRFLGNGSLVFLNFGMVLENCCLWHWQIFWKTIFFFNDFLNFCVPAQIPYLGKILVRRYRPKCSQPIRLQDFWINHYSRTNGWNSLIFCILMQIRKKVFRNFFSRAWSKMCLKKEPVG